MSSANLVMMAPSLHQLPLDVRYPPVNRHDAFGHFLDPSGHPVKDAKVAANQELHAKRPYRDPARGPPA
jgi:hypothetical protein